MPHKESVIPPSQIIPLLINGLNGRMLKIVNAKKSRQILLVYGHHSSLERYYGFAEDLAQYGTVLMPDLPGFGGMDSLYKIGEEASIDTLADYLAAVIKLHYRGKRFTLAGFSIGFAIAARMLQKYPDIAKQVDVLVSVAGFTSHEDFKFTKWRKRFFKYSAQLFNGKYRAKIFRYVIINGVFLRTFYRYMPNAHHKFKGMDEDAFTRAINFEVELWHNNEARTYLRTTVGMLTLDLTKWKVDLPVRHISLDEADQYFDPARVEAHLREVFSDCVIDKAEMHAHMPSVVATKEESAGMIPKKTRALLKKS